jgi:hypothetical protein
MANVMIGGVSVDIEDPCAIAAQLKVVRLQVVIGETVSMTRFDQDEVRFTPSNLAALDVAIADYERQCALKNGAARTRGARRAHWN